MNVRTCANFAFVFAIGLLTVACGSDENTLINNSANSQNNECEGDACDACETSADCADGFWCDDQTCRAHTCEPNSTQCEGGAVVACNGEGSAWGQAQACPSGVCSQGACGCTFDTDCGEDESCESIEICDEGDVCETRNICQAQCTGDVCGFSGELCCEGDTPICGPAGECAVDCGERSLCGEDFDVCCPDGDLCIFDTCRTPGESCETFSDCDWGEYCDAGIGRCLSDSFPDEIQCRLDGDFEEFDVRLKWSWEEDGIISIPVVGDVTGDGEPNVVINTTIVGDWMTGNVIVLDKAGQEIRRFEHDPAQDSWGSQGRSNIALGDVDGDGILDIIYSGRPVSGNAGPIVAARGNGELIWVSHDDSGQIDVNVSNGAVTVANFDDDPSRTEVVVGGMLIGHDGFVYWNEGNDGPNQGTNSGYRGGVALVADLTGDGDHEIVTGNRAWTIDWTIVAASRDEVSVTPLWTHDGPDGYPALADFDGDGQPEIALVGAGTLRILDGLTGELWCGSGACSEPEDRTQPIALPGPTNNNRGGPPTVADFDGDGRPEVGVAGGHFYAVFDINRPGFGADSTGESLDEIVLEPDADPPAEGDLYIRWQRETRDFSSNATGSAVFDFQGDGVASVIYGDECFMRSYSGDNGDVELEIMNSTGTILEYPLVVDVDANGRSEILIVANDINHCPELDGYTTRQGIFVYEDPNDRWVRTRSIWNQHAYAIDTIRDNGTVPVTQPASWTQHNTFRANRQGEVPLNSPDVEVTSLLGNARSCPTHIYFQATVRNRGTSSIPTGLPVSLFSWDDQRLQTVTIARPLAPGEVVTVRFDYEVPPSQYNRDLDFYVLANDADDDMKFVPDCNPDTAVSSIEGLRCEIPL